MRKRNNMLWMIAFLVALLVPTYLRAGASSPPADPIATLTASPVSLDWTPLADHERLVLTVAGPDGLLLRQELEPGKAPSLGLLDSTGTRLPDGSYSWELRVIPRRQVGMREKRTGPGQSPDRPLVQSGHFSIQNGSFVVPEPPEGTPPDSRKPTPGTSINKATTTDSLTVKGNACIGSECVIFSNGNSDANFPVLKLKAPNLGILFDDVEIPETSGASRNWALLANPGDNDLFSLMDVDNGTFGTLPVSVEGDAPANSLYIRNNGNLGLGTSTPAQDIHVISGNSPAIRLEQDGTGGPAARTWDVVGNEVGLSVRDVTNSSAVPFRIRAGAPASSLEVSSSGNVGIGTASPAYQLHVFSSATNDAAIGMGPDPVSGPAFNIGYGGASLGRSAAFLNVRPDASATAPNPSLRFFTGNTQRMIIDNEGFVGLGVANPAKPIEHSSGAFLSAGGVWTNASSRSAKHDIRKLDATDARAALAGLAPVRFRYNTDPYDESLGFIAEDVPDLVATTDRKSLSPMDIVAVLTKMVQEQERTIEDLSATVQQMRARLEQIEGQQP